MVSGWLRSSLVRAWAIVLLAPIAPQPAGSAPAPVEDPPGRIVRADIAAFDQPIVYNRFGSFNPFGMIFALGRDIVSSDTGVIPVKDYSSEQCARLVGTEGFDAAVADRLHGSGPERLAAGRVRLKDCKRARPLVLRANVGDMLEITVTNLLRAEQPGLSEDFCDGDRPRFPVEAGAPAKPYEHLCRDDDDEHDPLGSELPDPDEAPEPAAIDATGANYDWPATRRLSFVVPGLELGEGSDRPCSGLAAVEPGQSFTCRYRVTSEGTHLFSSFAAPAGGEGDGGSATHGLFGALIVEPKGSLWYRSQVTQAAFDAVWARNDAAGAGARAASFDYGKRDGAGVPVLDLLKPEAGGGFRIVHGDLNAVVVPPERAPAADGPEPLGGDGLYAGVDKAYREFTVIFHDELKTYYSRNFRELDDYAQFSGVGDGFAINYGSSGMGALLLANRKGMGPAADCIECVYEEFFLQSWANGDPALRETFPDDPSNVHHSYLNDRVVFRNFHVGKETHVFHLHAHQWLAGDGVMGRNEEYGSYLDSQTIGPQQGLTYKIFNPSSIYARSLDKLAPNAEGRLGWWSALGSGNRNRTPGDSIFHCHLYPHFAQGMWELWRTHDVIEDGSRRLPDGQAKEGLSLVLSDAGPARPGTDAATGAPRAGTPVPGLVPLPDYALPPLPTYGPQGFPGYPFYVAGEPGHRAPQPPMDMAHAADGTPMDGGLPRHVVKGGERSMTGMSVDALAAGIGKEAAGKLLVRRALALADFSVHLDKAFIEIRPADGTPAERRAMAFHSGNEGAAPADVPTLRDAAGNAVTAEEGTYPSLRIARPTVGGAASALHSAEKASALGPTPGDAALEAFARNAPFLVNGAPPKPGAPFADPCGAPSILRRYDPPQTVGSLLSGHRLKQIPDRLAADPAASLFQPDPGLRGFRRYEASVVELDLVVNKAGWHDPQSRINVLTREADAFKNKVRGDAEPFFFRAHSGDCVEFRHTNETPYNLERDDFQVKTPTDTIGQHIHLVKFDVTSADGSGNGWNYEDGTYAPGAVFERICAAVAGSGQAQVDAMGVRMLGRRCDVPKAQLEEALRTAHLAPERERYQTTVQRWFADPFLGAYSEQPRGQDPRTVFHDKSLRTVFTHDHFGPSSIQQHGFYNALLVEPAGVKDDGTVWRSAWLDSRTGAPLARAGLGPAEGEAGPASAVQPSGAVGAMASVVANEPVPALDAAGRDANARALEGGIDTRIRHRDTREAALAIADFAVLYDPKGEEQPGKGLGRLVAQAKCALDGACPDTVTDEAGQPVSPERQKRIQAGAAGPLFFTAGGDGNTLPPALLALPIDVLGPDDRSALEAATSAWHARVGQPVRPPLRPEAISQTHHDPYMVNYRNEPFPLRLGERSGTGPGDACPGPETTAIDPVAPGDGVKDLKAGAAGRIDGVFRSDLHGDPCTPVIEAYEGDPVQVRLIQGAQEVQHTFTVEGASWPRNVDEAFRHAKADRDTRRSVMSNTINPWAVVHAQEVGISEHFEANLTSRLSGASGGGLPFAAPGSPSATGPRTLADGLYHFGTMDALWNGAWGLTRTFEVRPGDRAVPAPYAGLPLAPLASLAAAESGPQRREATKVCPAGAPLVYAYAMAITLRDYVEGSLNAPAVGWPGQASGGTYRRWMDGGTAREGLFYDLENGLYDPDALVLVHVDPSEVRTIAVPGRQRLGVDKALLRARLNRQWARFGIEPYVLRVNAGDCLRWTVFNGLPAGFGGVDGTMSDAPGDALLPKIVQLNVDDRGEGANGRVVPTSRLALMPALPRLADARTENFPFGRNIVLDPASAPVKEASLVAGNVEDGSAGLSSTWLYAGITVRSVEDDEAEILRVEALAKQPDAASTGIWPEVDKGVNFCRQQPDAVLGARRLRDGRLVANVETCSLVPYAYGSTPIKSVTDPIGHASHGLYGTIVVETETTAIPERQQSGTTAHLPKDPICLANQSLTDPLLEFDLSVPDAVPTWGMVRKDRGPWPVFCVRAGYAGGLAGEPVVPADDVLMRPNEILAAGRLPDTRAVEEALEGVVRERDRTADPVPLPVPEMVKLYENVLFYQDGLNLWHWNKGSDGARPVGDCPVCDDSYDGGEKGIGYRNAPFFTRLTTASDPFRLTRERQDWADRGGVGPARPSGADDASPGNLNAVPFPSPFLDPGPAGVSTPFIRGEVGALMDTYVLLPQGRARQRAFVMTGHPYAEFRRLGYGSGQSALMAPGKTIGAEARPGTAGCTPYRDGPGPMFDGGAWGLVDVGPRVGSGAPGSAPASPQCVAGP